VSLRQDEAGVDVEFDDGTSGRYDLVIGADGVRSWTRRAIGIDVQTTPTGMGIWRAFTSRPESVTRTDSELEAVREALSWARPGDLLVLLVHTQRDEVMALLS